MRGKVEKGNKRGLYFEGEYYPAFSLMSPMIRVEDGIRPPSLASDVCDPGRCKNAQ